MKHKDAMLSICTVIMILYLSLICISYVRILSLVQKYVHHKDKLPEIFQKYLLFNNEIHSYNTRSAPNIHPDTSYGQRSVSYEAVNLWNNLPDDLKNISSLQKFKGHLKLYMQVENYNE